MITFENVLTRKKIGSPDIVGKDVRICYILGARNAPLPLGNIIVGANCIRPLLYKLCLSPYVRESQKQ